MSDYELIYRSPDHTVPADVIGGHEPGRRMIRLVVEEIEDDNDEDRDLRMPGHIRRVIHGPGGARIDRLEPAREAIETRYGL